jgi:hypothetical protein
VHQEQYNPQSQPHIEWPAAFPVARAYLDQLVRGHGLAAARTGAIARALDAAERQRGAARRTALERLAREVSADAGNAQDPKRARALAEAITRLAAAR